MANTRTDFPPVRACLFDMDGLLLDSEDKYSIVTNEILAQYGRPPMPWSVKARMQGGPGPAALAIFTQWADLPITAAEYTAKQIELQEKYFPSCAALPGVPKLLKDLSKAAVAGDGERRVHIALATSSHKRQFKMKTNHLSELFEVFREERRVLGDDPRIGKGRGKPAPDIWLVALKAINEGLGEGEREVKPEECLVFEDSVPGVESGRRAGMRCVWVPHPGLYEEFKGREGDVLAGRTGEGGAEELHQLGEVADGWAERLVNLETFPYEKFGIVVDEA